LTLEDETGLVNVIVEPKLFDKFRHACTSAPYVLVKGVLQSIWGVVSVKARWSKNYNSPAPRCWILMIFIRQFGNAFVLMREKRILYSV